MRCAALVALRGDDPDLAGEARRHLLQHCEAGRVDTVIVGEQHAFDEGFRHGKQVLLPWRPEEQRPAIVCTVRDV